MSLSTQNLNTHWKLRSWFHQRLSGSSARDVALLATQEHAQERRHKNACLQVRSGQLPCSHYPVQIYIKCPCFRSAPTHVGSSMPLYGAKTHLCLLTLTAQETCMAPIVKLPVLKRCYVKHCTVAFHSVPSMAPGKHEKVYITC